MPWDQKLTITCNNEDRGNYHDSLEDIDGHLNSALGYPFIHFLKASDDVIICKDELDIAIFCNKEVENLYGYKATEVLGKLSIL